MMTDVRGRHRSAGAAGRSLRYLADSLRGDWLGPVDGYRHLQEVVDWNRAVMDGVGAELRQGRLPILLGGDHCLGIGSITAVARHCRETGQQLRVLWLDAHADFNTHDVTPSGN